MSMAIKKESEIVTMYLKYRYLKSIESIYYQKIMFLLEKHILESGEN